MTKYCIVMYWIGIFFFIDGQRSLAHFNGFFVPAIAFGKMLALRAPLSTQIHTAYMLIDICVSTNSGNGFASPPQLKSSDSRMIRSSDCYWPKTVVKVKSETERDRFMTASILYFNRSVSFLSFLIGNNSRSYYGCY